MAIIQADYVIKTVPHQVYRREGYGEKLRIKEAGAFVSFAAGNYAARLEIYDSTQPPRPGMIPRKVATHTVGTDPTIAILMLTDAELALLKGSQYFRQVWAVLPNGDEIIIAESPLYLR